jgi:hypothetical protein
MSKVSIPSFCKELNFSTSKIGGFKPTLCPKLILVKKTKIKVRIRVLNYITAGGTKKTYSVTINGLPCGEYENHEDLVMCPKEAYFLKGRECWRD